MINADETNPATLVVHSKETNYPLCIEGPSTSSNTNEHTHNSETLVDGEADSNNDNAKHANANVSNAIDILKQSANINNDSNGNDNNNNNNVKLVTNKSVTLSSSLLSENDIENWRQNCINAATPKWSGVTGRKGTGSQHGGQRMLTNGKLHRRSTASDEDSGCSLEEYAWVPAGLKPVEVHRYFRLLPELKVPMINSPGEKWRIRQLLHQLPPQDQEPRYCRQLTEYERRELWVFADSRKKDALGRGTVKIIEATQDEKPCHQCSKPLFAGDLGVFAVRASKCSTAVWHPNCFVCTTCKELLVDLIYFAKYCPLQDLNPRDNNNDDDDDTDRSTAKIYCGRHYAELIKPRCASCDEVIFSDECTEAEGRSWHVYHFTCINCDILLGGKRYVIKDTIPYCLVCFDQFFAETCASCQNAIHVDESHLTHDGQHWHASEHCFACYACRQPLLSQPYLPYRGALFCSQECCTLAKRALRALCQRQLLELRILQQQQQQTQQELQQQLEQQQQDTLTYFQKQFHQQEKDIDQVTSQDYRLENANEQLEATPRPQQDIKLRTSPGPMPSSVVAATTSITFNNGHSSTPSKKITIVDGDGINDFDSGMMTQSLQDEIISIAGKPTNTPKPRSIKPRYHSADQRQQRKFGLKTQQRGIFSTTNDRHRPSSARRTNEPTANRTVGRHKTCQMSQSHYEAPPSQIHHRITIPNSNRPRSANESNCRGAETSFSEQDSGMLSSLGTTCADKTSLDDSPPSFGDIVATPILARKPLLTGGTTIHPATHSNLLTISGTSNGRKRFEVNSVIDRVSSATESTSTATTSSSGSEESGAVEVLPPGLNFLSQQSDPDPINTRNQLKHCLKMNHGPGSRQIHFIYKELEASFVKKGGGNISTSYHESRPRDYGRSKEKENSYDTPEFENFQQTILTDNNSVGKSKKQRVRSLPDLLQFSGVTEASNSSQESPSESSGSGGNGSGKPGSGYEPGVQNLGFRFSESTNTESFNEHIYENVASLIASFADGDSQFKSMLVQSLERTERRAHSSIADGYKRSKSKNIKSKSLIDSSQTMINSIHEAVNVQTPENFEAQQQHQLENGSQELSNVSAYVASSTHQREVDVNQSISSKCHSPPHDSSLHSPSSCNFNHGTSKPHESSPSQRSYIRAYRDGHIDFDPLDRRRDLAAQHRALRQCRVYAFPLYNRDPHESSLSTSTSESPGPSYSGAVTNLHNKRPIKSCLKNPYAKATPELSNRPRKSKIQFPSESTDIHAEKASAEIERLEPEIAPAAPNQIINNVDSHGFANELATIETRESSTSSSDEKELREIHRNRVRHDWACSTCSSSSDEESDGEDDDFAAYARYLAGLNQTRLGGAVSPPEIVNGTGEGRLDQSRTGGSGLGRPSDGSKYRESSGRLWFKLPSSVPGSPANISGPSGRPGSKTSGFYSPRLFGSRGKRLDRRASDGRDFANRTESMMSKRASRSNANCLVS